MWFLLTRSTGARSVRECKQNIASDEFTQWKALYAIEPWGDDWAQASLIASMLYNANRRRGAKAAKHDDFIPRTIEPTKTMTAEQIQAIFMGGMQ